VINLFPSHKQASLQTVIDSGSLIGFSDIPDGVTGGVKEKLDKDFKHWSQKR
jgi:hypothetical protein